jgi:hypothetical protein
MTRHDPEEFVRRVIEAIQAEAWVVDGNYAAIGLPGSRPSAAKIVGAI